MSEGLEPVYENLPGAVHGMENMLYFAAQKLRSLKTGEAYLHYAGADGIAAAQVLVPRVRTVFRTEEQYRAIRASVLEKSAAAQPAAVADGAIEAREETLFAEARSHRLDDQEVAEPDDFRVPAPKTDPPIRRTADPLSRTQTLSRVIIASGDGRPAALEREAPRASSGARTMVRR